MVIRLVPVLPDLRAGGCRVRSGHPTGALLGWAAPAGLTPYRSVLMLANSDDANDVDDVEDLAKSVGVLKERM